MEKIIGKVNIISGEREVGKTYFCSKLVEKLKLKGFSAAGIISPGIYHNNKKIGIASVNIKTGDKVKLADYSPGWDNEKPLRMWKINDDAIYWGNKVLSKSIPCDVLIIDELGFLELEENNGWDTSFEIINGNGYKIAFLVIRNDLLFAASLIWENSQIITIENGENIDLVLEKIINQIEDNVKN